MRLVSSMRSRALRRVGALPARAFRGPRVIQPLSLLAARHLTTGAPLRHGAPSAGSSGSSNFAGFGVQPSSLRQPQLFTSRDELNARAQSLLEKVHTRTCEPAIRPPHTLNTAR